MSNFAISTFCFGEIYYNQVNRMITELDKQSFKPELIVLTDKPEKIINKNFVRIFNIDELSPEYSNYANTYYEFDFSVKRYSLLCALNLGYTKVILTDADAVPNPNIFSEGSLLKGFKPNSIVGQTTYNFNNEIVTNSMLGQRFLHYEKVFNKNYDKDELNFMPEDCIQFIDIEISKFYNFLRTWDECINIKKRDNLPNTPAGNIDEMCFAALKNGISVGNNSDKVINVLINKHDKWYLEGKTNNDVDNNLYPDTEKTTKGKKIISSIYDLNYIDERGSSTYKGITLLTQTIRNIIFDGYEYVIYTDANSRVKHNLNDMFNYPNVTIKEVELNSEFYTNEINPIRNNIVKKGDIWDRIFCVHNYIEVIYNKIEFLLNESENYNGDVIWIDAGLFGTSCSNAWRDYMNEICHTENFVSKLFDKIQEYGFICLKGNHIVMNYELKDRIYNQFGVSPFIVPGALFGGNSEKNIDLIKNYKDYIRKFLSTGEFVSEQEILYLMLHDKNIKFFEFDDWDDLQKGILKIMDIYDELKYNKDNCGVNKIGNITENTIKEPVILDFESIDKKNFTEVADFFGIDKGSLHEGHMYTLIYEEQMKPFLDKEPVIVEIGISDQRFPGGCLKFWDVIFEKMKYYGFDILDCNNLEFNKEKISVFMGDQNNVDDLENFIEHYDLSNKIDFLIDDGSHQHEHIITSFTTLFPYLKTGGKYFIEDLHAGWAQREKTIEKINKYLEKFFKNLYELNDDNHKLLIIEKK